MSEHTTEAPTRKMIITRASDVVPTRVHWLRDDWIPLNTITLMSAMSGIGKSTVAALFAADATLGTLPGDCFGKPASVLFVSPEDDPSAVTRPRLEAAGADLDSVFFVSVTRTTEYGDVEGTASFPLDIAAIESVARETGAKLIVIDPIAATMEGDLDRRKDVRNAFDALAMLAQKLGIAVLLIAHNKKAHDTVRNRISGSAAITDAARSVLALARDNDTGQVIMSIDKSSYSSSEGSNFAFEIHEVEVAVPDGVTTTTRAVYIGASETSVAEINARVLDADDDDAGERNAMERFIYEYLFECGGSAEAKDVIKAGAAQGFREPDLKKARNKMTDPKISTQRLGFGKNGKYIWAIDSPMDSMDTHTPSAVTHGTHGESMTKGLAPVTPIGGTAKVSRVSPPASSAPSETSRKPLPASAVERVETDTPFDIFADPQGSQK